MRNRLISGLFGLAAIVTTALAPGCATLHSQHKAAAAPEHEMTIEEVGEYLIEQSKHIDTNIVYGDEFDILKEQLLDIKVYANSLEDKGAAAQLDAYFLIATYILDDRVTLLHAEENSLQDQVADLSPEDISKWEQLQLYERMFSIESQELQNDIAILLRDSFTLLPADEITVYTPDEIHRVLNDKQSRITSIFGVPVQEMDEAFAEIGHKKIDKRMEKKGFHRIPFESYADLGLDPVEVGVLYTKDPVLPTVNFFSNLYRKTPESPTLEQELLSRFVFSEIDTDDMNANITFPEENCEDYVNFDFHLGFDVNGYVLNVLSAQKGGPGYLECLKQHPTLTYYLLPEMKNKLADYNSIEATPEEISEMESSLQFYNPEIAGFFREGIAKISETSSVIADYQNPREEEDNSLIERDPNLIIHRGDSFAESE